MISMISIQVLRQVVDLKYGFDTWWKNVSFTLENIGTSVEITLASFDVSWLKF